VLVQKRIREGKMAKVIFENLTKEQAKTLAEWYEGQGEQDAGVWFDIHNVPTPMTDVQRKGGYCKIDKRTGDITVYCQPVKEE
jgi:hypothetical protein